MTKIYLYFLGAFLVLPIFFILSGSGIVLPDSYFEVQGVPLHANFLLLFFFPLASLMRITSINLAIIGVCYFIIGLLEGGSRAILFLQMTYFFVIYESINNIDQYKFNYLKKGFFIAFQALIYLHLSSIFVSIFRGNLLERGAFIFEFIVYQAYLTYPLVLVFALFAFLKEYGPKHISSICLIVAIFVIEIILMRRVSTILFLLVVSLFYYRYFYLLFAVFIAFFSFVYSELLDIFIDGYTRITTLTDGNGFTRRMTWERSFGYLTDIKILLFGNGLHNHSHNFMLNMLTTHGIIISSVFFYFYISLFRNFFEELSYSLKPMVFFISLLLIDWSFNVNINQPYYAGALAFLMIYLSNEKKFN